MVLFAIDKDIVPTSFDYVFSKNTIFRGVATVTLRANMQRAQYQIVGVKVTPVEKTDTYVKIRIEGMFIVPQDFYLNGIELGGYIDERTSLTAVNLGNMNIALPVGGYYVSVVVIIQSPQNFDFYVA